MVMREEKILNAEWGQSDCQIKSKVDCWRDIQLKTVMASRVDAPEEIIKDQN